MTVVSLCRCGVLILLLSLFAIPAQGLYRGYYNYPDIYGDFIVFSCEGDLWRVPAEGGIATRLTSDPGLEFHGRISPDGNWIAFAGQYDGNIDLYVISAQGGEPRRLTWHPYSDVPSDWTFDGKRILFFSAREHPHYERETFIVDALGGVPEKFPIGTASYAVFSPDGEQVAFNRNYVQTRTWKRYGGGLADDIWIGNPHTQEFRQLTEYFGNDLTPLFVGERLYFLSERDGRMNLWSMKPSGEDLEKHTEYADFDVRYPQTDGESRVVFQKGADIYIYDASEDRTILVDIRLPSDRPLTRGHFPSASGFLDGFDVSEDGRKTLVAARGDLFNVPAGEGRIIPLPAGNGSRESRVVFAGNEDEYAVFFSDAGGDYHVYRTDARTGANQTSLTEGQEALGDTLQPFFPLEVAPNGEKLAFADPHGNLYASGITTPTLTLVDTSRIWELREYEWSPDSRYLAYTWPLENENSQIMIFDSETGERHEATDRHYDSYSPTWDPDGKYLFFVSNRSFNRKDAAFEYETIMVEPARIYALLLNDDADNPFHIEDPYEADDEKKASEEDKKKEDESEEAGDKEKSAEDSIEKEAEKPKTEIVWEGLVERIIEFPMDSGDYSGLAAAKDKVFFFSSDDGETNLMSFVYTADEPEATVFAAKAEEYALSRERGRIIYRVADTLNVAETSAEAAGDKDEAPNLGGIRLEVDPREEWRQIFQETYRYNRDFFYSPTMGNVDWEQVSSAYRPLLDRVSTRQELTDLLGNLIGELGHGHTYIWGNGDAPEGRTISTGVLGVDFEADEEKGLLRLARIYRGERWSERLESPFNTKRTERIKDGAYLLAVNGVQVTLDRSPFAWFWGYGKGDEVLLRISPDGTEEAAWDYRVRLLGEDTPLRFHAWVTGRRDYVAEKSGGQLGYVYLPNMSTDGLVNFFRDYYPQVDKRGMVIDVRWNGGGNVSQLIIRRLRQELYAMMSARSFDKPSRYPVRVFTGPMACVINQRCGSDGDIFSNSFRHFELGPLIGTRTWGGTVGIRYQTKFVDGAQITIPEFAFYDFEQGFEIENHGISPDEGFGVENRPEDEVAGRDPQLDRAIEYLLKEMEKEEYQVPRIPAEYPDRSTESFRKRSEDWRKKP